jgi:hypothetical protein
MDLPLTTRAWEAYHAAGNRTRGLAAYVTVLIIVGWPDSPIGGFPHLLGEADHLASDLALCSIPICMEAPFISFSF